MGADADQTAVETADASVRAEARAAFEGLGKRAAAARSLWFSGHAAVALRLSLEALRGGAETLERLAPGALGPEHGAGVRAEEAARVRAALDAAGDREAPAEDADVDVEAAAVFERAIDAWQVLAARLHDVAHTTAERRRALVIRGALATGALAALTATALFVGRPGHGHLHVRASDTWYANPSFAPALAADGDETTAWLLPDHATGWLDVRITPGVTVRHVRLLNAWNAPPGDRGTRAFTLELYAGPRLVRTLNGVFPDARPPDWIAVDAGGARGITRIRFVVRSSYRSGGGLAELDWD